jgi:NAD+ synthase (glutamine-hydrolysing)
MIIRISQLDFIIGDFENNTAKMLNQIEKAKNDKVDIICFAELATTGYPPRDFLEFNDFIRLSNESLQKLADASTNIAVVAGAPSTNPKIEGKDLFNSVYFMADGEIKYVQHKALLPTYDIFDEYRYFEPATEFGIVQYKGKKIALTVCEDIWNIGNENPLYTICPMDEMIQLQPDFAINVSASPFSHEHTQERRRIVRENALKYKIPFFYVNHIGAQTQLIFDGGSLVVNQAGFICDEMPFFEEAEGTYDLNDVIASQNNNVQELNKLQNTYQALVLGVRDYFRKLGLRKAIVSLSGGIDSALTCVIAVEALGRENVQGLLLPSMFSSDHSVEDARQLAENLNIHYDIIPIKEIYDAFMHQLNPHFEGMEFNVTEENVQARIRGTINMAFSNKFGPILLNTSNKSEIAVGYGTLYGDLCGGLSVIGDLYKTEVFEMSRFINKDTEIIPYNTINKPPSAELRPNQKDTDSLPDYDILDTILYEYIEKRKSPGEIIAMGYDEKLVKRILKLVNTSEFKRHQTAPILRVSNKAFGMGRRMPIVGKYLG